MSAQKSPLSSKIGRPRHLPPLFEQWARPDFMSTGRCDEALMSPLPVSTPQVISRWTQPLTEWWLPRQGLTPEGERPSLHTAAVRSASTR